MSDLTATETVETVADPMEVKAREMGWKPQEEFTGDAPLWVDAKEFVGRKPLFDKIHDQSKRLGDMEKTLKATADHVKKVGDMAYKRAVSDLERDRRDAISVADVGRVAEIDSELKVLANPVDSGPPAEYMEWVEANPWFTKDDELFAFACANYDVIAKKNPTARIEDTLKKVEDSVKRAYPEKFPKQPTQHSGPATVEGGTTPSNSRAGPGYSSLNADQKRVCDNFVRHGVLTREQYVKSLVDIGELK